MHPQVDGNKYDIFREDIHSFGPAPHPLVTVFHDFWIKECVEYIDRWQIIFSTSILYQIEVKVYHLKKVITTVSYSHLTAKIILYHTIFIYLTYTNHKNKLHALSCDQRVLLCFRYLHSGISTWYMSVQKRFTLIWELKRDRDVHNMCTSSLSQLRPPRVAISLRLIRILNASERISLGPLPKALLTDISASSLNSTKQNKISTKL